MPADAPEKLSITLSDSIVVDRLEFLAWLGRRTPEGTSRDEFLELARGLTAVVNFVYFKLQEKARASVYAEGLWDAKNLTKKADDCRTCTFKTLLHLLRKGHYHPVTTEIFDHGVTSRNHTAEVNAKVGMDLARPHALLRRVLEEVPYLDAETEPATLPAYCNRVLLYTTGYRTLEREGMFVGGKLNALLDIGIDRLKDFARSIGILPNPDTMFDEMSEPSEAASSPRAGDADAAAVGIVGAGGFLGGFLGASFSSPFFSSSSSKKADAAKDVAAANGSAQKDAAPAAHSTSVWGSQEEASTYSLKTALEESYMNLFKPVKVRQLIFNDLVVIFPMDAKKADHGDKQERRALEAAKKDGKAGVMSAAAIAHAVTDFANSISRAKDDDGLDLEDPRASARPNRIRELSPHLNLRVYRDLPVSDLGLVLPDKLIRPPSVASAQYIVEAVFFLLLIRGVFDEAGAFEAETWVETFASSALFLSVLAMLLYRLVTLAIGYYSLVSYYKCIAQTYCNKKCVARQEAAVEGFLARVVDQELKAIAMAYWLLWREGPMTAADLDHRAELTIYEEYSVKIDFDVQNALMRLKLLGLAKQDGARWLTAATPTEFLNTKQVPWTDYLHHVLSAEV